MPNGPVDPAAANLDVFNSPRFIATYQGDELMPPERRLLDEWRDWLRGRAVLDLGVGAGRTTPHLLPLCGRYVGVDYAPGMVAECRRKFPGADFRQADAAALGGLADGSFDLVLFSYNGLDSVGIDHRRRVLDEAGRLLAPGGLLAFSSHNLARPPAPPGRLPFFSWTWRPDRLVWRVLGAARRGWAYRRNWRRNKPHEDRRDGVAVLVDAGHDYGLLLCFITPQRQARDLADAGFALERVLGADGRAVGLDERPDDEWLYYVARKPAG